jgi:hypothetical protein
MHVLSLSHQKTPTVEAIFGMVVMLSHQRSFAQLPPMMQLVRKVSCLGC